MPSAHPPRFPPHCGEFRSFPQDRVLPVRMRSGLFLRGEGLFLRTFARFVKKMVEIKARCEMIGGEYE